MRDEVKIARNTIARTACFINFLPFFTSCCFLAGLSRKLKEYFSAISATRAKRAVNQCLNDKESYHPGEHLFKSQKSEEALKVSSVHNLVKAWCKAVKLKGNYGSHTLRKTWGYHQRVTYRVDIPTLMVCFNHATQKQTLDYLCIQPEEITNVFNNEL